MSFASVTVIFSPTPEKWQRWTSKRPARLSTSCPVKISLASRQIASLTQLSAAARSPANAGGMMSGFAEASGNNLAP